MPQAVVKHRLKFIMPSGTSRGILHTKDSHYTIRWEDYGITEIGECSLIDGLSPDDPLRVKEILTEALQTKSQKVRENFPACQFAVEMMYSCSRRGDPHIIFPSEFTKGNNGIPINGLIWMGSRERMYDQIVKKLESGFDCIKLKIGAIDFDDELNLLQYIRSQFGPEEVELRLDANGAFSPDEALEKLKKLSAFRIHSIEQPVMPGQWEVLAKICAHSPIDVALDEELIGIEDWIAARQMLKNVRPQYIILKPSLLGGFFNSKRWIDLATENGIGWWVTSALESNIGLNAIAQWTATLGNKMPQGLGTGQLFSNNIPSPLRIEGNALFYDPSRQWDLSILKQLLNTPDH